MSHRFPPARWLAASCLALSFVAPSTALAAHGEVGCANVDVLVTRGSAEPAGSSIALDAGTDINSQTGVWSLIRKEMQTPTDGSTPIADQKIVDYTGDGVPDTGQIVRTDIDYPADLPFPSSGQGEVPAPGLNSAAFRTSVRKGVQRNIEYMNAEATRCPKKRFVLLGYSQGALVVANVVTNRDDVSKRLWMDSANTLLPRLSDAALANVAAVGMFADAGFRQENGWATHSSSIFAAGAPSYLVNTYDDYDRGFNDGNSSHLTSGLYPRDLDALEPSVKGKIRSYCIQNDGICQAGGGLNEHLYYGDASKPAPRKNLAIFVIQQLRNQADKTFTAAQCTITQATNTSVQGQPLTVNLRFQATVKDRTTSGGTAPMTNVKASLTTTGAATTKLRSALNGATTVTSSSISHEIESTFSSLVDPWLYDAQTVTSTAGSQSIADGTTWTATASAPTVSWQAWTTGRSDLTLQDTFTAQVNASSALAKLSCAVPAGTPSSVYNGRHFGRFVIS